MQTVDVTAPVWSRLLDMRRDTQAIASPNDWSTAEQHALELYGPVADRVHGPTVIGQIGQSLDGRIATVSGDARDVSGPDGLAHLHRLRALADGVIVGVRTALQDSPRLTVRLCDGPHPARILIDPRGRLPDDAPVFADDGVRRLVIQAVNQPRSPGIEVIRLEATDGRLDPQDIAAALHGAGLHTLLVEGGGFTISQFVDAGLLDRLHVAVAPLLIGGGSQGLTLPSPPDTLAEALQPETSVFSLGSDVVFDCVLGR